MAEQSYEKGDRIVLRWHLSRIYEEERFGDPGSRPVARDPVDVSVRPWRAAQADRLVEEGVAGLRHVPSENLEWWSSDEEEQLLGWVEATVLLDAVQHRNAAVPTAEALRLEVPRQLVEDMVLVQELADSGPWLEASAAYRAQQDQPNLDDLVRAPGSRWLDLTLAARLATKTLYRRVLGETADRSEEGDDAKQR